MVDLIESLRSTNWKRVVFGLLVCVCLFIIILARGCSSDDDGRIEVYGRVEAEDGEALAEGQIFFKPTSETEAPQTAETIDKGEYRFSSENGPMPGKYDISIVTGPAPGRPGQGTKQEVPKPRVRYKFTRTIGEFSREQDFTLSPENRYDPESAQQQ